MKADPAKITQLLKTARGQLDGILKMVDENQYCMDISNQILACQAILKKANVEIIRSHMGGCVQQALTSSNPNEANQKIEELTTLLGKLM